MTLADFEDETSLLPFVVAERVLAARDLPIYPQFVRYVEEKCLRLYIDNGVWKRNMRSAQSRDILYSFVNHWLDAWLQNKRNTGG